MTRGTGWKKLVSILLVCILMMQLVPASVLAEVIDEVRELQKTDGTTIATEVEEPATIVGEVETARGESVKHYRLSDGSFAATQYAEPVHYKGSDGQWQDIDNTLTLDGEMYTAQAGEIVRQFPKDLSSGQLFEIAYGDYSLSMSVVSPDAGAIPSTGDSSISQPLEPILESEASVSNPEDVNVKGLEPDEMPLPARLSSEISYKDAYKDTDIVYENHGYSIKESIVVNSPQSSYTYVFRMMAKGLSAELTDDGSVELKDEEGTEIFTIPAPYMTDADGAASAEARYVLDEIEDGYILGLIASPEWLNASDRVFPVVVDPSVYLHYKSSDLRVVCLRKNSADSKTPSDGGIICGRNPSSNYGVCQTAIQVETLPAIPKNCVMVSAQMAVYHAGQFKYGSTTPTRKILISAYKLNNVSSNILNLTWNGVYGSGGLGRNSRVLDCQEVSDDTLSKYVSWDVTSAAADWYGSTAKKGAMILVSQNEDSQPLWASFVGHLNYADSPYFIVNYRNTVGIEDYYTYQTVSAGRGGSISIGDYSNQLTLVKTLAGSSSEAMSAEISLVYNTAYAGQNFGGTGNGMNVPELGSMKTGQGWKLSVAQTLKEVSLSGTTYIVYNDADGTEHYFSGSSDTYKDEDGLGLTIVKGSGGYTMTDTDKYHTWTFSSSGLLTSISDSNGNVTNINYSNGHINSVSVTPDGGTALTVAELTYNRYNYLETITDECGEKTTIWYTSDGKIRGIDYPGGAGASYEYDSSGYMTSVKDNESGYGVLVNYWENGYGGKTVYQVREYSGAQTNIGGGFHAYKNSQQLTSYRFYGPDHTMETPDDTVVYYAFDHAGRTICSYETNSEKTEVIGSTAAGYTKNSGTSAKNNRLTCVGAMGLTTPSVKAEGSFERAGILDSSGTIVSSKQYKAAAVDDKNVRTGQYSMKLSPSADAESSGYVWARLTKDESYTVSCYINTSGATDWNDGSYSAISIIPPGAEPELSSKKFSTKTTGEIEEGWQRISYTFQAPATGTYRVGVKAGGFGGSSYADDLQIDRGETAGEANLVLNHKPSSDSAYWEFNSSSVSYDAATSSPFGAGVIKINGKPEEKLFAAQNVPVYEKSGGTYIVSGWGKGEAIGSSGTDYETEPYFGMLAAVYYEGQSGEEWHYIPFNKEYSGWQYASGIVIPKKDSDVRMIKLYLIYSLNGNSAYFDNVSIVKEPCSSYSYDDKGNPVSAKEGGAKTSCEYESGTSILKKYTSATGVTTSFTYESGTHNLTSASTGGVTSTNTYNAAGLVTKTETRGTDGKQVSSARYNGYGQKTSVTDENNVTTQYGYTTGHRTEYVQRGTAPSQYYDYYEGGRSSMTYMEGVAAQHYRYSNGQLTALERKSRSGGSDFIWQSYRFGYDAFGNMMSVSVGSEEDTIELARYEYETGVLNGRLHKLSYGNGNSVTYSYDIFDRTTEETYNSGNESISYSYMYDSSGALTCQGSSTGEEYNYEYDSLGRLVRSSEYNNGAFEQRTEQIYDAADRLTKQSWYNGGGVTSLEYTYSGTTGLLSKLSANLTGTSIPVTYSYNGLNQISGKTVNGKLRRAYAYDTFGEYTKSIPQYVNYRDMNGALIFGEKYQYDANGRIEEVCEPETPYGTLASYGYDVQGQLTTATVGGTSYTYTYDTAGNILTSSDGEETHEYSYGNSTWRDLLTAYDGQEISYDGCGNPVSYYDGSTFTWTQGRRLAGYANGSTNISYAYDMAGVRSSKTVNGTEYRFTTLSGLVTRQEWDGNSIDFVYDENNQPLAMKYNNTLYYYILNVQGDVIALADQNGNLIAKYTYDPWGKLLKVTPNGWLEEQNAYYLKVAEANPLRYRGYYYDSETGFYYLQSRYYDPNIGRFINADSYASTDATGLLSTNMFAYCENDPVCKVDVSGEVTVSIFADLNATLLIGVGIGFGVSFDDHGNIAIQWYYSHPFDAETVSVGLFDVGASAQFQITECETVDELNGISSSSGFSVGGGLYAGADVTSNKGTADTVRKPKSAKAGFKAYIGYGAGVDVHEQQTKTNTLVKFSVKKLWHSITELFT